MAILTKEQILAADDLPRESVEVPEWGGEVLVRALTAGERDAFEAELTERRGKQIEVNLRDVRAKLCSRAICDGDGKRLFTDQEVQTLAAKSASALTRVFEVAQRLSGLTGADVEALTKN